MAEVRAYDMSRYQRIIGVESERITGKFAVLATSDDREAWVSPVDVTVWDEGRHSGRVLYGNDLVGSVLNGNANLVEHMVSSSKLADVQDVWDEMKAVLVAVVEKFRETPDHENRSN